MIIGIQEGDDDFANQLLEDWLQAHQTHLRCYSLDPSICAPTLTRFVKLEQFSIFYVILDIATPSGFQFAMIVTKNDADLMIPDRWWENWI